MRGKVLYSDLDKRANRITPAHAGKSNYCGVMAKRNEDHPRPCGEKKVQPVSRNAVLGSPPPMRGKESQTLLISTVHRITPAHAGKRSS